MLVLHLDLIQMRQEDNKREPENTIQTHSTIPRAMYELGTKVRVAAEITAGTLAFDEPDLREFNSKRICSIHTPVSWGRG